MTTLKKKSLLLLNSDKNAQGLPSLLFAQATSAVEECDPPPLSYGRAGATKGDSSNTAQYKK